MISKLKTKIDSYLRSEAANLHGLIMFLAGGSGLIALTKLQSFKVNPADGICGLAMLLGALLYGPKQ